MDECFFEVMESMSKRVSWAPVLHSFIGLMTVELGTVRRAFLCDGNAEDRVGTDEETQSLVEGDVRVGRCWMGHDLQEYNSFNAYIEMLCRFNVKVNPNVIIRCDACNRHIANDQSRHGCSQCERDAKRCGLASYWHDANYSICPNCFAEEDIRSSSEGC